jgi:hypothetical protein
MARKNRTNGTYQSIEHHWPALGQIDLERLELGLDVWRVRVLTSMSATVEGYVHERNVPSGRS